MDCMILNLFPEWTLFIYGSDAITQLPLSSWYFVHEVCCSEGSRFRWAVRYNMYLSSSIS